MALTVEMHDPVGKIFEELEDLKITQSSIALTYAFILAQEPKADWPKINAAIVRRWPSKSSLLRVKTLAWKYVDYWRGTGPDFPGRIIQSPDKVSA